MPSLNCADGFDPCTSMAPAWGALKPKSAIATQALLTKLDRIMLSSLRSSIASRLIAQTSADAKDPAEATIKSRRLPSLSAKRGQTHGGSPGATTRVVKKSNAQTWKPGHCSVGEPIVAALAERGDAVHRASVRTPVYRRAMGRVYLSVPGLNVRILASVRDRRSTQVRSAAIPAFSASARLKRARSGERR